MLEQQDEQMPVRGNLKSRKHARDISEARFNPPIPNTVSYTEQAVPYLKFPPV